eukprot:6197916-Prymnesium_polylepis.1
MRLPPPQSSQAAARTLLLFGAGYIGERVARRALAEGFSVVGTTRSPARADQLRQAGVQPLLFSGTEPLPDATAAQLLPSVTHLLSTVPPSNGRDPVLDLHSRALRDGLPRLDWLGHISTAEVYGQQSQEWIDEACSPRPVTPAAKLRLLIEHEWGALALPLHIFRPAAVYGPGRGPQVLLRQGKAVAIEQPGHVASRVHVDDVARLVVASMCAPHPNGAVYNAADDEPAPPAHALALAAELLQLPPPPRLAFAEAAPQLSASARAFWSTSLKLRAARRDELGVALHHPSFREGLRATIEAEGPLPHATRPA